MGSLLYISQFANSNNLNAFCVAVLTVVNPSPYVIFGNRWPQTYVLSFRPEKNHLSTVHPLNERRFPMLHHRR